VVARTILRQELWEQMEVLEQTLTELPGVDEERVSEAAKRAGNSSEGRPPRPRADDPIGTARYFTDLLLVAAEVLAEQERRISDLEASK
jgi:hypothetical protein